MTDFLIEDEKAALKTKPSYPGCCEQQASPRSPCTKRIPNSQEAGGWRVHWRNLALLPPWEDGNKAGSMEDLVRRGSWIPPPGLLGQS